MNRKKRRQAKKQGKQVTSKPCYPLIKSPVLDIQQIKQQATKDAADLAFRLMLSLPCIAMNRYWGFGKKRCGRLVDQCLELYKEFSSGDLTQEQMLAELKRLGGVEVVGDEDTD